MADDLSKITKQELETMAFDRLDQLKRFLISRISSSNYSVVVSMVLDIKECIRFIKAAK